MFQTNGKFDLTKFKDFFKNNPDQAKMFEEREKDMVLNGQYQIYNTMVKAGMYTTKAEGKFKYALEQDKVNFDYVGVMYSSVKDSEVKVTDEDIIKALGAPRMERDKSEGNEVAGVVTGLAWTSVGGDILFIESLISKGKGTLTLTGNLGNVMKESATIALEYIKANASLLGIKEEILNNYNIHIHVPEGATPKDGPSAGIAMITSLVSVLTQKRVKKCLAMTGEITLRGKVLPVGGIKEKILAAKRANIKEIILCAENKSDIDEIKPEYLIGLKFHFVKEMSEVIAIAVTQQYAKNAKKC
jgi:ATP-dependent Lon protease